MQNGISQIPSVENEPIYSYTPGTPEGKKLIEEYQNQYKTPTEIPMIIGGKEVFTGKKQNIAPPHDIHHSIGVFYEGDESHVNQSIQSALEAKKSWKNLSWEHRAAIFLKAADLVSGKYRYKINAATMLGQGKNVFQSEIDAVCELADFLRFNVKFMTEIYENQPLSSEGVWNRVEYRPLEGFVFAVTPFNFTAIAANLFAAPALMGNTVVWKPSPTQIYSAHVIMQIFQEAGLPDGVVNMIFTDGPTTGDIVLSHPDFSGLHFTGSTKTFKHLWKQIGNNIDTYKSYPRVVGETGGKDYIWMHESACVKEVGAGIIRGAFEFQGQKCSAASRAYIPKNRWEELKKNIVEEIKTLKQGSPEDPSNFVNAVIDEVAFKKISGYIDSIKEQDDAEIIAGGGYDMSKGYFIEPTVVLTTNPNFRTMKEEIFGPVITVYVYPENKWKESLDLVKNTSEYALTGAIYSRDRYVIEKVTKYLSESAGNFYINDKPTGAVVGQQPFGGGKASGTNDKAGSSLNLMRWVSARTIKETLVPVSDYRYPFLEHE